jgi:hypothetical protein
LVFSGVPIRKSGNQERRPACFRGALARGAIAAAILGAAVAATAAGRNRAVSFRYKVDVPEEGLRLTLFNGAKPGQIPTPPTRHLTDRQGRMIEAILPQHVWLVSQMRGLWQSSSGDEVALARVGPALPADAAKSMMPREEYDKLLAGLDPSPPKDAAGWQQWAEVFGGGKVSEAPAPVKAGMRIEEAWIMAFEGPAAKFGCAFRLRPGAPGEAVPPFYFALIEFATDVDPAAARKAIVQEFLPGVEMLPRRPSAVSARPGPPSARPTPGAAAAVRSPQYAASRDTALATIRGLPKWYAIETPNYIIVSDLTGSRASAVKRIESNVEALRAAFAKAVAPRREIDQVSVIRVFGEREDYLKFAGRGMEWTGGFWSPTMKQLVISPTEVGGTGRQKDWLVEVVHHEGFHQYLFYALGGREVGMWFNEGHAGFFEGAEFMPGGLQVGEVERRMPFVLKAADARQFGLDKLLRMDRAQFYGGDTESHYAIAWGLVYYLRKGAPLEEGAPRAKLLDAYVDALCAEKTDADKALEAVFTETVTRELEQAMCDFWRSTTRRSAARRNDVFAGLKPTGP